MGRNSHALLYRLDIFNSFGAVRAVARLAYESDDEAIRAVKQHSQNHRMELWQGDRLVKRFEARQPPVHLDPG